jgi:molybdopterin synthase catalytic subunit
VAIRIQEQDFSLSDELAALLEGHTKVGGVVSFLGTVRDFSSGEAVQAIEVEHYPGMTEGELDKIESAARARFDIEDLLVVHRVGRMDVSENIVLVVAAAMHRAAAFDACRFVIDHLKVHATFWKKEFTADGSRWVDSCPGCEAAASQWEDLAGTAHVHDHPPTDGRAAHEVVHGGRAQAPPAHGSSRSAPTEGAHHHGGGSWAGLRAAILTLSDSRTLAQDTSGDALEGSVLARGAEVAARTLLPDDREGIEAQLIDWLDRKAIDVVLTTGGTGPGPRDCTPEATLAVCDRAIPGLSELMRAEGLRRVRSAALSRGVVALRGVALVVNLPGSTRGAAQSFESIADLVPHTLRMARGGGH